MRCFLVVGLVLCMAAAAWAGGEAQFGAWMQVQPEDPNLRTISIRPVKTGIRGSAPEAGFALFELHAAVKNPTPTTWGMFNVDHFRWAVVDARGKSIPVHDQTMMDVATGQSGDYQFLPGQTIEFVYYLQVPQGPPPSVLRVSTEAGHFRTIRIAPALLDGHRVAATPGDAPGTKPYPGTAPKLGEWAYPPDDKNAISLVSISRSSNWSDGPPADGQEVLHAHFAMRNDTGGPWGVFNSSAFNVFLIDKDEATVSGEIRMYDARTKKIADDSEFAKGERKDFILDIAMPKHASAVKLIVLRSGYAFRYDVSKGLK